MQFLHPEFFYALPALLIPVFIHLFQLRRFKVQEFTNVALLQKIRFQTLYHFLNRKKGIQKSNRC